MTPENFVIQLKACKDYFDRSTQCSENIFRTVGNAIQKMGLAASLTVIVGCSVDLRAQEPVPKAGYEPNETKGQISKIAFVSNREGNNEIYIMNPDASNLKNITTNKANDMFPAWSPDGKTIAFQSDRDGNPEIYVMKADGGNVKRLTNNTTKDDMPAWSPDGKRIAYVVKQNRDLYIHVMNADGSEPKRLSDGMSPSWSPDGKRIAFNRGNIPQIYIMDSDGDKTEPLTKPPSDVSELTPQEMMAFMLPNLSPLWSPDGKRILFTRVMQGAPEGPQRGRMNYEVFTMNTEGEDQRRLTVVPGRDTGQGWSPDSKEIVFTSRRDGNQEIYVMNVDGTNQRRLTDNSAADFLPSWSPILSSKTKEKQ